MTDSRLVDVPRNAFRFCRWTMAALIWFGVLTHNVAAIVVAGAIMALSAILTVRQAPLVALWRLVVEPHWPSPPEPLDRDAMRFAHSVATVALIVPVLLLQAGHEALAWRILTLVAVFKTIGAAGFCPVSRMYGCVRGGGTCCRFLRRDLDGQLDDPE